MATISTDDVVVFIERELARHSLAGNSGELRQIRRITAYLARVAEDVGDAANQQRFLTLFSAADVLLRDQPAELRG
ncbi:MAG: hypothetical protein H0T53_05435 [Herpetosiphonaceae bacterium]|nr:hypothetical protein [Herpetosiphonaceae bacterium]